MRFLDLRLSAIIYVGIKSAYRFFRFQLTELGNCVNLPLFLHCRAAAGDLHDILKENKSCFSKGGVVHSFDGTVDEMKKFIELGLHIGINGW
jgi:TatD DNase family protein